jgi:hypothetical protein
VRLDDLLGGDLTRANHPGQGAGRLTEDGEHGGMVVQPERRRLRGGSGARYSMFSNVPVHESCPLTETASYAAAGRCVRLIASCVHAVTQTPQPMQVS